MCGSTCRVPVCRSQPEYLHTFAGILQAAALTLLACTSWMLPWLIPSVSFGFLSVATAIYYYVSDQSETSILAFVCSCFVIFLVAAADIVTVRACPSSCFRRGKKMQPRLITSSLLAYFCIKTEADWQLDMTIYVFLIGARLHDHLNQTPKPARADKSLPGGHDHLSRVPCDWHPHVSLFF